MIELVKRRIYEIPAREIMDQVDMNRVKTTFDGFIKITYLGEEELKSDGDPKQQAVGLFCLSDDSAGRAFPVANPRSLEVIRPVLPSPLTNSNR